MTREIKFRAKRLDNNEFVIGYYLPTQFGEKHFIYSALEFLNEHTRIQIDPKTIGQYTGLLDKNGKEIYEGDVVKSNDNHLYVINFKYGSFGANWIKDDFVWHSFATNSFIEKKFEVVGNIFKNPELIGGGNV